MKTFVCLRLKVDQHHPFPYGPQNREYKGPFPQGEVDQALFVLPHQTNMKHYEQWDSERQGLGGLESWKAPIFHIFRGAVCRKRKTNAVLDKGNNVCAIKSLWVERLWYTQPHRKHVAKHSEWTFSLRSTATQSMHELEDVTTLTVCQYLQYWSEKQLDASEN